LIILKRKAFYEKINRFKNYLNIYKINMNNIVDIIEENKLLKAKNYELEERLKKYTCGRNHKKYYENNKEKIMEKGAKYLEKLKEYRRNAYLKSKEKKKNLEKEKVQNISE
jgi:glutamate racemase